MEELLRVSHDLGDASTKLRHLCLNEEAAWILELLIGVRPSHRDSVEATVRKARLKTESNLDKTELFREGRKLFLQNEYFRAAECFYKCNSPQASFLKYYAKYLAARRQSMDGGRLPQTDPLRDIEKEIERRVISAGIEDSFLFYLYGLVSQGNRSRDALLKSIRSFHYNWSAWMALLEHVKTESELEAIISKLPDHWMRKCFLSTAYLKFKNFTEGLLLLKDLSEFFPESGFLYSQLASYHYYIGNHDTSMTLFKHLLELDPCRRKGMDLYGNLLYVMGKKVELSILARRMLEKHKYSAEACCVIGNHYSMKRNSRKAVEYFQRAAKLDKSFLTARLFMAQEYLEMRENANAIEMVQKVLDKDQNNYYAWNLLGQAYAMTDAYSAAEQAFQKACCLWPHENKIWVARGTCYMKMKQLEAASWCFKKAQELGDDGIAVRRYMKKLEEELAKTSTTSTLQTNE